MVLSCLVFKTHVSIQGVLISLKGTIPLVLWPYGWPRGAGVLGRPPWWQRDWQMPSVIVAAYRRHEEQEEQELRLWCYPACSSKLWSVHKAFKCHWRVLYC